MTTRLDRKAVTEKPRAPLVPVCAAFIVGLLAGYYLDFPAWTTLLVGMALACVAALAAGMDRSGRLRVMGLLLVMAVMGWWRMTLHERLPDARDLHGQLRGSVEGEGVLYVTLRGVVAGRPVERSIAQGPGIPRHTRFDLTVTGWSLSGQFHNASGRVRVNVREPMPGLYGGDEVEVFGKLSAPRGARNPGEFDYRDHLDHLGIRLCMSVNSAETVKVVAHPGLNIHALGVPASWLRSQGAFRPDTLDQRASGMLRCLVLGERYGLDNETEESFRRSGTVHLLAVSGLHVAVLLGTIWYVLRLAGMPERWTALVVTLAAVGYATVAGMQPSVVRAAVVAVVLSLGVMLGRRPVMLNSLALAAMAILLLSPGDIFSPGFQLSFLAVLGLVLFTRRFHRLLNRFAGSDLDRLAWTGWQEWRTWINRAVTGILAVSLSALVLTLPFSAYHFRIVNLLSPLFNVVLFPLFEFVLISGFVVTFLTVPPLTWIYQGSLALLLGVVHGASLVPGAAIMVPRPAPAWIAAYYLCVTLLSWSVPWITTPPRTWRFAGMVTLAGLLGGAFLWIGLSRPAHDDLTVLDVGQGCATVLTTHTGRSMVYDCGSTDRVDVGGRVVAPFLLDRGFQRVDVLVLSHPDQDHVNGVRSLLTVMPVTRALLSPSFQWTPGGLEIVRRLEDSGATVEYVRAGTTFRVGEVEAQVLSPSPDDLRTQHEDVNDSSVVLRLVGKHETVMLWGDAGPTTVRRVTADADTSAGTVLFPHHGSAGLDEVTRLLARRRVVVSARLGFTQMHEAPTNGEFWPTWRHGAVTVPLDHDRGIKGFLDPAPANQAPDPDPQPDDFEP